MKSYCNDLAKGVAPVAGKETLTNEQVRLETLSLGFRTMEGIDLKDVIPVPHAHRLLSELEASGFLKIMKGRVMPTEEGFMVADHLPLWFSG